MTSVEDLKRLLADAIRRGDKAEKRALKAELDRLAKDEKETR